MRIGDSKAYSITQYNHRSKFKRFLILLAEKSVNIKYFLMNILEKRKRKYTPSYISRIDKQFESSISKMPIPNELIDTPKAKKRLFYDVLFCDYSYGAHPDEYFFYRFYWLNVQGRKKFITDRIRYEYYQKMNDPEKVQKMFDKYEASVVFQKYYKRETLKLESAKDADKLKDFISRHKDFIKKPYAWGLGIGIEICKTEGASEQEIIKLAERITSEEPCVIEELIIQDDTMASIHPTSVNTIRWVTIVTGEEVRTFHPFIKWGVSGSVIDNAAQGGILAGIDEATGIVNTQAVDKANHSYTIHPTTKKPIVGFQVPQWEELRKMVLELATVMPDVRYVGWDLALTKNKGWVVVECNPWGEFIGQQWPYRTGLRDEFESIAHISI